MKTTPSRTICKRHGESVLYIAEKAERLKAEATVGAEFAGLRRRFSEERLGTRGPGHPTETAAANACPRCSRPLRYASSAGLRPGRRRRWGGGVKKGFARKEKKEGRERRGRGSAEARDRASSPAAASRAARTHAPAPQRAGCRPSAAGKKTAPSPRAVCHETQKSVQPFSTGPKLLQSPALRRRALRDR